MTKSLRSPVARWGCAAAALLVLVGRLDAGEAPATADQVRLLQQQNEQLQQQLHRQQELIDALTRKVSQIQEVEARRDRELGELKTGLQKEDAKPQEASSALHLGKVNLTGEGGLAFFHSDRNGQTPNAEFRVDEARLFVEAPIWNDVYLYSEVNLTEREQGDLTLRLGELYLDFENVSQLWNQDRMLNLRVGRFYIPFGEEYQNRFAIDNPLISHSLTDLWGVDEGVELYGSLGKAQYVLAVQNGGDPTTRDFNADKAVVGRLGYDPTKWLHLSASGMRTGDLDTVNDGVSALWFGGGWFRALHPPTTTKFHANLAGVDARLKLPQFTLRSAGGYIGYGDNDPTANNHRDVYYYYFEAVKDITRKFYAAARFSEILAPGSFPIVGNGDMGTYFGKELTAQYWRLSLGLGYRFNSNLMVKGEYSFNQGREQDGTGRRHENFMALEAAYKF